MNVIGNIKRTIAGVIIIAIFLLAMPFSANALYTSSTYTVKSGDTLNKISIATGASVNDIKTINYLSSDAIFVGQSLKVKTDSHTYKVVSGDTLWLIAKNNKITVDYLKGLNNLKSDALSVGQVLKVLTDTITHTVKSGDTLWKISSYFGATINDIKHINNLTTDELLIGQKLLIPYKMIINEVAQPTPTPTPSSRPTPVLNWPSLTYIVQAGDYVSVVAAKFGVSQSSILKYNYMDPDQWLNEGEKIAINGYAPRQYAVLPGEDAGQTKYGHIVDWFLDGQYLIKRNDTFKVTDLYTGKSFTMKMMGGYNHSDSEPLTSADTAVMKELWPSWNWSPRPVVIYMDGMNIAASLSGMPHSFDTITDNGVTGHFDLYLLNSIPHSTGTDANYVQQHYQNIQTAAGK